MTLIAAATQTTNPIKVIMAFVWATATWHPKQGRQVGGPSQKNTMHCGRRAWIYEPIGQQMFAVSCSGTGGGAHNSHKWWSAVRLCVCLQKRSSSPAGEERGGGEVDQTCATTAVGGGSFHGGSARGRLRSFTRHSPSLSNPSHPLPLCVCFPPPHTPHWRPSGSLFTARLLISSPSPRLSLSIPSASPRRPSALSGGVYRIDKWARRRPGVAEDE